jgi:histidinol-phosphate aminotransferase
MTGPEPKPGLMEIAPYVGGESDVPGKARIIKLASNEGALGPSPRAMEAYRAAAEDLHRYPDGECRALREALADAHGMEAGRIVCGAGSDELITLLCRAYAGPGDEVLYSQHGFLMYPIAARAVGAQPVTAPETDLRADVDALLAAVSARTRILFLANPNNPTGSYLTADEVARLRRELSDRVLLVIDAAYAEFVGRNDYDAGAGLVDRHDNLVVTRTFSKIHALAALRLGWAYCPPAVADVLNRVRNPFNVSGPAQAAGVAALADVAFTDACRDHNDRWLRWTIEKVRGLGLDVPPSVGNFILVRFPEGRPGADAAAADAYLKDRGIIARRMGAYGLRDGLRLSIGTEQEMRCVVDALTAFMDAGGTGDGG